MIRHKSPAPAAGGGGGGGGDGVPADCSEWSWDDEWYCARLQADADPTEPPPGGTPPTDVSHTYRHYDFVPMGCGAQWYSGKVGNISEILLVPGEYWLAKAASGTLEFRKSVGATPAGTAEEWEVIDPGTYINPTLTITEGACS